MKKIMLGLLLLSLGLVGCTPDNSSSKEQVAEETLEIKNLSYTDINVISLGDSTSTLNKNLGKPKKIWSNNDFIYDELEQAISRDEFVASYIDDSEYDELIEAGNSAAQLDNLEVMQYDYTTDEDEKETFLVWVDPTTDSVVYKNARTALDTSGHPIDSDSATTNESSESDTSTTQIQPKSLGEEITFSSEDGDKVAVKVDSVTKDPGDGNYYIPENGNYAKVNFTVTNTGTSPFDVSAHYFEFYDGTGMKAELNSRDFYSETIQSGKSSSGTVYFDIKNDTPDFEIFFADSSWEGTY